MKQTLWRVIPATYRRRAIIVAATIFLRSLLNFVGIAVFVPILILILDSGNITSNSLLSSLNDTLNIGSYDTFVFTVCAIVVGIIILKSVAILLLYRFERDFTYSLYKVISQRLYADYHSRGLGFIKHSNSAILTRNVNVVSLAFVTGVLRPIASIVSEATLLLLIYIALAIYSPTAALIIVLIFAPAILLFYYLVRHRQNRLGQRENEVHKAKSRIVSESFRGYADIEVNGANKLFFNRFNNALNESAELRKRNATIGMLPQILMEVMLAIGLVLLVITTLHDDSSDIQLLFGMLAVAAVRLIPSVRNIMTNWSTIRYNRYTMDIITESNTTAKCISDIEKQPIVLHHNIEIRDLEFRFDDAASPTISHLSLKICRGEKVGIRGSSGIGKSTLFNLILGLYRPTSGAILIDGEPLTDDNIQQWRQSVGYVSQSVFIADMTLAENIALGIEPCDIDQVRMAEAIRLANLDSFVAQLPDGINSSIGEQGSRLSGGQRQRIGIARALYKGCDILLLDEATSSLDNQSEESINRSLHRLSTENSTLTIVVIAHRDSSLEYCDRVITIE